MLILVSVQSYATLNGLNAVEDCISSPEVEREKVGCSREVCGKSLVYEYIPACKFILKVQMCLVIMSSFLSVLINA